MRWSSVLAALWNSLVIRAVSAQGSAISKYVQRTNVQAMRNYHREVAKPFKASINNTINDRLYGIYFQAYYGIGNTNQIFQGLDIQDDIIWGEMFKKIIYYYQFCT